MTPHSSATSARARAAWRPARVGTWFPTSATPWVWLLCCRLPLTHSVEGAYSPRSSTRPRPPGVASTDGYSVSFPLQSKRELQAFRAIRSAIARQGLQGRAQTIQALLQQERDSSKALLSHNLSQGLLRAHVLLQVPGEGIGRLRDQPPCGSCSEFLASMDADSHPATRAHGFLPVGA